MSPTTATVVIAILAVTVLFIVTLMIAATFRQVLTRIADARDTENAMRDAQLQRLLDRFMAIRWEDYVSMQAMQETPEEGGFLTPEEQHAEAETQVIEGERWGPLSRKAQDQQLSDTEQKLLDEDFP